MDRCGILWDMDGVLADSTRLHYQSWINTFQMRGVQISEEMFKRTFGQNNRAVLTDFFGRPPSEQELAEIGEEKEIWFREHIPGNMKLLPGVLKWLQRFQEWKFAQAVASSAPPENIEIQVDSLGIRPYFGALVSASRLPGKPNPAVFLKAAEQLGVDPTHCLVMEDAPAGIEGALRAGMKCVAVLTTHPANELSAASLIVKRLTQLKELQVRRLLELDKDDEQGFCPFVRQTRSVYRKPKVS